jgi:hypothetical protein
VHLDEVGEQPLHAADQAPVHHHRAAPAATAVHVGQIEPRRLVEVELDGGQGRLAPRGVPDLDVDLRSVEGRLPRRLDVRHPGQRPAEQVLGPAPHLVVAHVLLAGPTQRQPERRRPYPEGRVRLPDQVENGGDLLPDLLQGAEVVRVVQRDGAYPAEPTEHPGPLRPVHPAQLGDPQRQLAVGPSPRAEDQRVVRTERRAQHELVVLREPHHREHVVGEVAQVPGELEQLPLAQWRRIDVLVAGAPLQLADVLLDGVPGGGAGRQPDRQAGTGEWIGMEQFELAAQPAVVVHGTLLDRVRPEPGTRRSAAAGRPGGDLDREYDEAPERIAPGLCRR